ncbi:MAG TPA: acetyl-CoA carboxylase biotin carboxyl carrier protein [Pyrinomonadaceae bacterium]|nr:acetyl-CoA carboxylase biotin carboxyl carrier protein [Pyrinomonadaceae bacterium]
MSEEKRAEASTSDEASDSGSDTTRQQSADARRRDNVGAGGGGNIGGGRHGSRRRHREREPQQQQSSRPVASSINMDELRELADLIAAQGFTEFELEKEGFRLRLSRNTYPQTPPHVGGTAAQGSLPAPPPHPTAPANTPSAAAAAAPAQVETTDGATGASAEDLHTITSPIVGTFYRAPSPTADLFVKQGSHVDPDSVVCIIEAMKLMNEIQAEVSGTIEKIYVENGQPVEYGQPLFGIKK